MMNQIKNGDYVPQGSGLVRCFDAEARLQDALFRLQCRRGSFPFLPELGSNLWQLGRTSPAAWQATARQYCAQALNGTGVTVKDLSVTQREQAVCLELTLQMEKDSVTVEVSL